MKSSTCCLLLATAVLFLEFHSSHCYKLSEYHQTGKCDPLANIFVINLEGKAGETRRAAIRQEFEKAGIHKYTLWPATNKKTDIQFPQVLEAGESIRKKDGHQTLGAGEAALALSHQRIYKHLLKSKLSCALVFEDDTRLAANFASRLNSLQNNLTMPFDWIKIDWELAMQGSSIGPKDQTSMPHLEETDGSFASGYIVSAAGAQLLIDVNTPLWMNADGVMDPSHIKSSLAANERPNSQPQVYHVVPSLSWQGNPNMKGGKETEW